MGNCETQSSQAIDFELELEKAEDETLQANLSAAKQHAPKNKFARLSNEKPVMLNSVKETLQYQKHLQPLLRAEGSDKGVHLPVYYLNKKKAFYEGEWNNGQPHGNGKVYFENGSYFEGKFRLGAAEGPDCLFIYPDGSYKRGAVSGDKMNGEGKFYFQENGMTYFGQWKDDLPHGVGKQIYEDGSKYEGEFFEGKKHCAEGVFEWANGKKYVGPFENGLMEGQGTLIWKNGYYKGKFKRGLKWTEKGQVATMKTEKGEYTGPFVNGQMEGSGEFRWNNGKRYQGQFANGQLHGKGYLYISPHEKRIVEWEEGNNIFFKVDD